MSTAASLRMARVPPVVVRRPDGQVPRLYPFAGSVHTRVLRGDPEVELGAGLGAQTPMLVDVMSLAAHGEVVGVVLAARPVIVDRVFVMNLCRPSPADLARPSGASTGRQTGAVPHVSLTEGAFACR